MWRSARVFALVLTLLAGVAPLPAAAEPPRERVAAFAEAQLSPRSVLGLLLMLLSAEEARVREQLEALYEAGYISTVPGGSGAVSRYLAAVVVSRYGDAGGDLMAVMLEYQRLLAREAREDRRSSRARLAAATVRIAARLEGDEAARFVRYARDWLGHLEGGLQGLGEAELEMLGLQELISHRQRALVLATNFLIALNESTDAIISNTGGGGSAPPAGPAESLSESEGGAGDAAPICRTCP